MRRSLLCGILLSVSALTGCGGGDEIYVTGVLLKNGTQYTPPEDHKLALYFHKVDVATGKPAGDVEMAAYQESDGSFSVPGRVGSGIAPGNYRIAVVETLRREALDRANKSKSSAKRINEDTNFLETTFGETTSQITRDLRTSTKLTIDLANPAG